ncbi:uncharacterized protein LOC116336923 [Contarinia nasturtii]|uniref:uncharacterized protein LOC116336923 n=1 Tax=Contarinia nasturtii TaxID=265458 RepID=UPI0012D38C45|nr:uncharacterized protein LOC116336923 [Contarinia nasturtii]
MLWKKETIKKDSPFTNLLAKYEYENIFRLLDDSSGSNNAKKLVKNEKLANHYRKKGMVESEAKNWTNAIELINEALCFAKRGTESMGCGYAERAACFLNLKMYDRCLVDIKLARANNCPSRFLPRLKKWSDECKKMLKLSLPDDQHEMHEPQLSFDANEQCPCTANVIRIENRKTDDDEQHRERCIIATHDIGVGQTVLVEDGFVWTTSEKYKRCTICLKTMTNLIPCENCTDSLLCAGSCEKTELHQIECAMDLRVKHMNDDVNLGLVVRSILMALHCIPNLSELIKHVDRIVSGEGTALDSVSTDLSRYTVFLENGLKWQWPKKKEKIYLRYIKRIFDGFMDKDDFEKLFGTKAHERFLMHLIGHHICALQYAANNSNIGHNCGTTIYAIVGGFLGHSCKPNAVLVTSDRKTVAVTIRPIEKGEEITISYLQDDELDRSSKYRRKCLLERYKIQCKCQRCTTPATIAYNSKASLTQQLRMELRNVSYRDPKKQAKRRKLTQNCVKYLNTNGRARWNDDMSLVLHTYIHLLRIKYYLNLTY